MRFLVAIPAAAVLAATLVAALVATIAAGPAAAQTKLVDTYRDWATFRHDGAPGKVCFAAAEPQKSQPKTLKRSKVFFYVSAWPQDNVRAEVSVKLGFAVKKGSPATIKIGPATFKLPLFEDDKAFFDDRALERKIIKAMKLGATMTVEGRSDTGKTTKDTYSLRGITKAIDSLSRTCR